MARIGVLAMGSMVERMREAQHHTLYALSHLASRGIELNSSPPKPQSPSNKAYLRFLIM